MCENGSWDVAFRGLSHPGSKHRNKDNMVGCCVSCTKHLKNEDTLRNDLLQKVLRTHFDGTKKTRSWLVVYRRLFEATAATLLLIKTNIQKTKKNKKERKSEKSKRCSHLLKKRKKEIPFLTMKETLCCLLLQPTKGSESSVGLSP